MAKTVRWTYRRSRDGEFPDHDGYVVEKGDEVRMPIYGPTLQQQRHLAERQCFLFNGFTPEEYAAEYQVNKRTFTHVPMTRLKAKRDVGRKLVQEFFDNYRALAFDYPGLMVPLPILLNRASSSMRITDKRAKDLLQQSISGHHLLKKVSTDDGICVITQQQGLTKLVATA